MADEHRAEEMKGRAKEAAGAITGDRDLKREGRADQGSAKVKRGVDEAADKVNEAVEKLTDRDK